MNIPGPPECLLRNVPILINKKIWGGWHYVNDSTGRMFKAHKTSSMVRSIDFMMSNKFSPRDDFMSRYGFKKSTKRLANTMKGFFEEANGYDHIYFSVYKEVMEKMF